MTDSDNLVQQERSVPSMPTNTLYSAKRRLIEEIKSCRDELKNLKERRENLQALEDTYFAEMKKSLGEGLRADCRLKFCDIGEIPKTKNQMKDILNSLNGKHNQISQLGKELKGINQQIEYVQAKVDRCTDILCGVEEYIERSPTPAFS